MSIDWSIDYKDLEEFQKINGLDLVEASSVITKKICKEIDKLREENKKLKEELEEKDGGKGDFR